MQMSSPAVQMPKAHMIGKTRNKLSSSDSSPNPPSIGQRPSTGPERPAHFAHNMPKKNHSDVAADEALGRAPASSDRGRDTICFQCSEDLRYRKTRSLSDFAAVPMEHHRAPIFPLFSSNEKQPSKRNPSKFQRRWRTASSRHDLPNNDDISVRARGMQPSCSTRDPIVPSATLGPHVPEKGVLHSVVLPRILSVWIPLTTTGTS